MKKDVYNSKYFCTGQDVLLHNFFAQYANLGGALRKNMKNFAS